MVAEDINEAVLLSRILPKDHLCLFFVELLVLGCSIHVFELIDYVWTFPLFGLRNWLLFLHFHWHFFFLGLFLFLGCEDQLCLNVRAKLLAPTYALVLLFGIRNVL